MIDLLSDPVFQTDQGSKTLPQVLTSFSEGAGIRVFTNLRPHHRQGWECFLSQVATMALHEAGFSTCDQSVIPWEKLLLDLTEGDRRPWNLVVEDPLVPAFFQCPWDPKSEIHRFNTPDSQTGGGNFDIFATKEEMAIKSGRILNPTPDHWVYALVTRQTMSNSVGRGWSGASRVGFTKGRQYAAVVYMDDPGLTFRVHVNQMLARRADQERRDYEGGVTRFNYKSGKKLLWLYPWFDLSSPEASTGFTAQDLDPYFIDMARAFRLFATSEGQVYAQVTGRLTSDGKNAPRATLDDCGVSMDPWCPRDPDPKKFVRFTSESDYRKLAHLVAVCGDNKDGDLYIPSPCQTIPSKYRSRTDQMLVVQNFVCDQGKFAPFFRREIPLPPKVEGQTLGLCVRLMLAIIGGSGKKKPGVNGALSIAAGELSGRTKKAGPEDEKKTDPIKKEVMAVFHRNIDRDFFDKLALFIPPQDIPLVEANEYVTRACYEWARKIAEDTFDFMVEAERIPAVRAVPARQTLKRVLAGV